MAVLTQEMLSGVTVPVVSSVFSITTVKKTFQINITGTAIAAIEASNDGVTFSILFPAVSANSILLDESPFKFYRAVVKSIISGSVTVILAVGTA